MWISHGHIMCPEYSIRMVGHVSWTDINQDGGLVLWLQWQLVIGLPYWVLECQMMCYRGVLLYMVNIHNGWRRCLCVSIISLIVEAQKAACSSVSLCTQLVYAVIHVQVPCFPPRLQQLHSTSENSVLEFVVLWRLSIAENNTSWHSEHFAPTLLFGGNANDKCPQQKSP